MSVARLDTFHIPDSVPVLREFLRLVRCGPVVVRLVVRIGSGHQLAVVPRIVGKDLGVPLRVRAPEPELSALDDVVVACEHSSGVAAVVVTGDEILLQVIDEHRVGHIVVLPPGSVNAVLVEIHSVERLVGDRPMGHPVLAVECGELHALREYYLIVLVHKRGDIRPVKHRVVVHRRVHQTAGDLHIGFAGMEGYSDGPGHSVAIFSLPYPDCLAAVGVAFDPVVARSVCRGPVMMEHIPFHTSGHPGPEHSDIRRLDHVVVIEYVVAVGLVHGVDEAASDLRKDTQFDIFILHIESLVGDSLLLTGHIVVQEVRIDASARPLVGPVPLEDRSLLRVVQKVGGHIDRSLPGLHFFLAVLRSGVSGAGEYGQSQQKSFHFYQFKFIL